MLFARKIDECIDNEISNMLYERLKLKAEHLVQEQQLGGE